MFDNIFGTKKSSGSATPTAPKSRKVNIEKRFAIISTAGSGSMSSVHKAYDNQTGRTVCLKVQDQGKSAAAASRASRLGRLTEGDVGIRIIHPNVARTFEHGETTTGAHYLLMEYIDGVSLNFIRQSRVTTLAEKLEMLAQAADALTAVHAAGFIHHDVGPKNLMINRENYVKLIDFGLAVPNTPAFHRPGNRTGTLQYMAPELICREPTNEMLDIFSFGVMMFEFLTNRLPYDAVEPMAQMRQRINGEPMDINLVAPQLPDRLKAIVTKMLKKSPKDRWPSMESLGTALRGLGEASVGLPASPSL